MIQSFKQFRKRHLSNDPAIALFPLGACGKASTNEETTQHSLMKKDEDDTKIGDDDALSHVAPAADSDDESVLTLHPMEPIELDHPIRCPHPEPCIIQDGRALKERLRSLKRRGPLPFLTEQEVHRMHWNGRAAPSDGEILPTASAAETSFTNILP